MSKQFDFRKNSRDDHEFQEIVKELGIHQTSHQGRERIKQLQTDYWRASNQNHTSVNSSSSCLFYSEFDWGLGTVPRIEPPELHNNLVSQDGNLLTPESSIGLEGSQQVPDEATIVTGAETDP
ncbi:unnamed protein product [Caretta caretta]